MAGLGFDVSYSFKEFNDLARQFPSFGGRLLSLIGKRARWALKIELLSGQELNLKAFPTDSLGRRTITSDVNRRRTQVKIYSYPTNLFNSGRRLRNGKREQGKHIVDRKLKQIVASRMGTYVAQIENEIIKPGIKDAGF